MPDRADAIVVLGCRVLPSGRLTTAAARRAAKAAEAYQAGVAPHIVTSGGRRWGAQIEAEALRRALVRAGVPEEAVTTELWSLTTHENAAFSAEILRRREARRVLVVTCAWHVERAIQNFRRVGVDAWPLPSEGVRVGALRRAYRHGHELVCAWLDRRALRRAHALVRAVPRPGPRVSGAENAEENAR
ncbi:YdcF family protein [Polyangium sp. 15x6]|uniref:YdcF family protein n=1 Tax=Polyangium sp. 15x6 TaxID=3042687 RepID=UPI00249B8D86|nr:YdcF family protein [Polyangium sp. 15x6]MDI3282905.1 YdcF family protein [Polyangium sp. 15x6]